MTPSKLLTMLEQNTNITKQLQYAIDQATTTHETVVVPPGHYTIGTINLRAVTLHLSKGTTLLASPNPDDYHSIGYEHNELGDVKPLLYAMGEQGPTLCGPGTLDLNARAFFNSEIRAPLSSRIEPTPEQYALYPKTYDFRSNQPLFFHACQDLHIEDIRILDSPCWTITLDQCDRCLVRAVTILNDRTVPNSDGIHVSGSRDVIITQCTIDAGDDCIALSAITDWTIPCERIVISDCLLQSSSKAIVVGYMHSLVRSVTISNVIIHDSNRALCIMSSEGTGVVEDILISNCSLSTRIAPGNWWGNGEPIAIITGYHHNEGTRHPIPERDEPVQVRQVRFQNLTLRGVSPIGLVGSSGNIRDVHFTGVTLIHQPDPNLSLKGRVIDTAPAPSMEPIPGDTRYAIYLESCSDIVFDDFQYILDHEAVPPEEHIYTRADVSYRLNGTEVIAGDCKLTPSSSKL